MPTGTLSRLRFLTIPGFVLCALAFLYVGGPGQAAAQAPPPPRAEASELTLDRIFASSEFNGEHFGPIRWSKRASDYFTLDAAQEGDKGRDLVRNDPATGKKTVLIPAQTFIPEGKTAHLNIERFAFADDESKLLIFTNSQRVWRQNTRGDYWVLDIAVRKLQKLGGEVPAGSLLFAKLSPDATHVAYVRENNVYVQDLSSMTVTQLTTDGSPTIINGTSDWVNEEELNLRDCFRWSPDSKAIAFWQFDTSGVKLFHLIDNTSETYPKITSFPYPKVGEKNSATRLGVVSVCGGPVCWLDLPGDPREHYLPHMEWAPDSSHILVQQLNRLQNANLVMLADPKTSAARTILTETDAAWLENDNSVRWLDQGRSFLWLSERDGWRHAYIAACDGKRFDRITSGDFDVIDIEAVDEPGGWLYFGASPENATQHYLYRVRLEGGTPERVSPGDQPGWHTYDISPDARWAVHTYSTFMTPPRVSLISLPDHRVVRVLVDNARLQQKLTTLRKPNARFLRVDIGNGVQLDAWCLEPPSLDPAKKYPLLFHVYGEPQGHTVLDSWPGQRGLWHWMLAQQGYLVASVENRGTNVPRGRAWRKIVYRQIGALASKDQAEAAQALLKLWPYADAHRVGIWGWSGGGSMSLNAIFRYPEVYRTAVAVAPVANQLLYDSIYQERYMGLPTDNADGYREGSPSTHARKLEGNLLVVHGTGDDNVHYQGTEMLINELVAHGKQFTVMPYPGRSHGIYEGRNTIQHFNDLITRYLDEHLKGDVGNVAVSNGRLTRVIAGWTVHVSQRLLHDDAAATARALELLQGQLEEINCKVPPTAVKELKKVELWVSPEYPGVQPRAEYHPNADWLREHGRDPVMARGVEFTNVRIFEAETRRMPNFALHELAHAYHDRVLSGGHANAEIAAAYEKAKASGKYDHVERWFGDGRPNTCERAYAMTNPMEYFAEDTEAFFSRNDFFPFTRDELKQHDPEMFHLLEKLWGVQAE